MSLQVRYKASHKCFFYGMSRRQVPQRRLDMLDGPVGWRLSENVAPSVASVVASVVRPLKRRFMTPFVVAHTQL